MKLEIISRLTLRENAERILERDFDLYAKPLRQFAVTFTLSKTIFEESPLGPVETLKFLMTALIKKCPYEGKVTLVTEKHKSKLPHFHGLVVVPGSVTQQVNITKWYTANWPGFIDFKPVKNKDNWLTYCLKTYRSRGARELLKDGLKDMHELNENPDVYGSRDITELIRST